MSYKVQIIDRERCRLKIEWEGSWSIDDAKAYEQEYKEKIDSFGGKPFTVLVDQKIFNLATQEASDILVNVCRWILKQRMDKGVVISGSPVAKLQMTRVAMKAGTYKKLKFVDNEREAWEYLGWD